MASHIARSAAHLAGQSEGLEFLTSNAGVTKQIVSSLLFLTFDLFACDYDTAICKGFLFCKGMGVIIPSSLDEFWEDIFSTGIGFGNHNLICLGWLQTKNPFFLR